MSAQGFQSREVRANQSHNPFADPSLLRRKADHAGERPSVFADLATASPRSHFSAVSENHKKTRFQGFFSIVKQIQIKDLHSCIRAIYISKENCCQRCSKETRAFKNVTKHEAVIQTYQQSADR